LELGADGFRLLFKCRAPDGHHRSNRIYSRNFNLARRNLPDHHVSGLHGANLILELHGFMGQHRVASAENTTGAKFDIELDFHCRHHVDFADGPKPPLLEGRRGKHDCVVKADRPFLTT